MKVIASNKRAYYDYNISDKTEAGIELEGCEVKSVRAGGISINESFITIDNNEMLLKNAYVKPYEKTTAYSPNSKRNRKLLLHKKEISKFAKAREVKGMTIVPVRVYINDKGLVKLEIALGKGKKLYDKRETLKQKSANREIDRALKDASRGWQVSTDCLGQIVKRAGVFGSSSSNR